MVVCKNLHHGSYRDFDQLGGVTSGGALTLGSRSQYDLSGPYSVTSTNAKTSCHNFQGQRQGGIFSGPALLFPTDPDATLRSPKLCIRAVCLQSFNVRSKPMILWLGYII